MGNSTKSLQSVYDVIAGKGIPDPRNVASGYGDELALELGTQIMADLISERFNWKYNRAIATPIYTNSWQQDYPQPAQPAGIIGWGEDCDLIDINNTSMPKPMWHPTWRRQLSSTSVSTWRPNAICWMYNRDLNLGQWPGAGVTYYPLVTTAPNPANPIMSMLDQHGNILIVTGFGTTGATPPTAAAKAAEGTTVTDGTVTWTVVSPDSQGFRLSTLPNQAGPTYQVIPYFQIEPPTFANMQQLLNPIPDSYSRHFFRGLESACLAASPNPADKERGRDAKIEWLNSMPAAMKQGDRELNAYALIPAQPVTEERFGRIGPYTADQPY